MALKLLHFKKSSPGHYQEYIVLTTGDGSDEEHGKPGYELEVFDIGCLVAEEWETAEWPAELPLDRPLQ